MRSTTKQTVQEITDCFTGADGGIQFAQFKGFLEVMDERAAKGDAAAQQVLGVMERINRMLKVPAEMARKPINPARQRKKGPVSRVDEDPLGYPGDGVARFD